PNNELTHSINPGHQASMEYAKQCMNMRRATPAIRQNRTRVKGAAKPAAAHRSLVRSRTGGHAGDRVAAPIGGSARAYEILGRSQPVGPRFADVQLPIA